MKMAIKATLTARQCACVEHAAKTAVVHSLVLIWTLEHTHVLLLAKLSGFL